jgi:hypothetical protein
VKYLLQLRPDVWARLELPRDLTVAEVARLERFLRVLVADQTPEASPFDGRGVLQDGSTPERMRG